MKPDMTEAATPITTALAERFTREVGFGEGKLSPVMMESLLWEHACRMERDRAELISALRKLACYVDASGHYHMAHDARELLKRLDEKMPPYPFCSTPDKCAGLGSCPRDPVCCD